MLDALLWFLAFLGACAYTAIGLVVGVMMAPFYGWFAVLAGLLWPPYLAMFFFIQKIRR